MSRVIVITSGKGGVGKTTTAINLGVAISQFNKEVIVVDGNLTTPNVSIHLGAPIVPVTLNHVLNDKASPIDAIYEHESGVKILPSSLSVKELKKIKPNNLNNVAKKLKALADIIIFDSAAGLGKEALAVMEVADEIIIVTNPDIAAVTDALKTLKVAEEMNKHVKGVIVTRVEGERYEMSPKNIKEMLEIPILGFIPEDKAVKESIARKNPVVITKPNSKAAKKYKELAAKILGERTAKRIEKEESIFKKFLKSFGL